MLFANIGLNLFMIILIANRINAESRENTSNEELSTFLPVTNESHQAEKNYSLLDLLIARNEYIKEQGPCYPNPCKNGGSCLVQGTEYVCVCTEPFYGKNCDDIDYSPSYYYSSTVSPSYRWSSPDYSPSYYYSSTVSPNYRFSSPDYSPSYHRSSTVSPNYKWSSPGYSPDYFRSSSSSPSYRWSTPGDTPDYFRSSTSSPSYRWSTPGYTPDYFRSSISSPSYEWTTPGDTPDYFRSSTSSPSYRWSTPGDTPDYFRSSTSSPSYRWSTPACSCGDKSTQCYFDTYGQKKCVCLPGYAQIQDICSDCYCGSQSLSCRFNSTGDKICECKSGYSQKDRTCAEMCVSNSDCLNDGFCKASKNGSFCECKTNFIGDRCEKSIMCDVLAKRCLEIGAVCVQRKGKAGCECPPDKVFTLRSAFCEDICDSTKCVHGRCEIIGKSYRCSCEEGFSGSRCDERSGTSNKMSFMFIIAVVLCIIAIITFITTIFCICRKSRLKREDADL